MWRLWGRSDWGILQIVPKVLEEYKNVIIYGSGNMSRRRYEFTFQKCKKRLGAMTNMFGPSWW